MCGGRIATSFVNLAMQVQETLEPRNLMRRALSNRGTLTGSCYPNGPEAGW
jgi:hypothetical protein